jgi:antitoxin component HigA of HigAB toxin-antitoxin module
MTVNHGKPHAAALVRIDSEEQLERATKDLCDLVARGEKLTTAERRYLNVLATAVESYEAIHHPIPEPSDAALLRHLLDAKESSPAELAKATGVPLGEIKKILRGKQQISTEVAKFAAYFHVGKDVFHRSTNKKKSTAGSTPRTASR